MFAAFGVVLFCVCVCGAGSLRYLVICYWLYFTVLFTYYGCVCLLSALVMLYLVNFV